MDPSGPLEDLAMEFELMKVLSIYDRVGVDITIHTVKHVANLFMKDQKTKSKVMEMDDSDLNDRLCHSVRSTSQVRMGEIALLTRLNNFS